MVGEEQNGMITLKEGIQEEYTKAILSATEKHQIDLLFTEKILRLIIKRADMVRNYENRYDSQERYVIEHFLKELLKE